MPEEKPKVELTLQDGYHFEATFDQMDMMGFAMDEPEPTGKSKGPNATRVLAAAVGNCLSASLLFCLRKAKVDPDGLRTRVEVDTRRNDDGRLRVGGLKVSIRLDLSEGDRKRARRCLEVFEDYCVVTQSVRDGIDVEVGVDTDRGGDGPEED